MKNLYLLLLCGMMCGSGCRSAQDNTTNTDTAAVVNNWKPLFDGKTTKGWHTYGKTEAGKAWKAENGVLHLDASQKADWQTKNGGDLTTDEEFENYEFSTEWKISKAGNSGIIFNVHEDAKKYPYCWYTGIETQVCDNDANEDGHIPMHRTGDLYDLMSISQELPLPAEQWNKTVIILNNGRLNIFLNNTQVLSTTLWDDNWKRMVTKSKFNQWPDFGTFKKGHISLQDHGADVWYRDIKIRKL